MFKHRIRETNKMSTYIPVPCKGHPGWYEITGFSQYAASRRGEVLNKRTMHFTLGGKAGRYLRVSVFRDAATQRTLEYVHDLICTAFHGPRPEGMIVGHGDNNRFNNRPINLKWITQSENIKQTYDDGIRFPTRREFML